MPINQSLYKIVIGGTIGGTQSWSTGIWATNGDHDVVDQGNLNADNALIKAVFAPLTGSFVSNIMGASTKLDYCRTYAWASNATVSSGVSTDALFGSSGSGDSMPSLLAVVASLRSGTPGRSGRGRNYLPLTKVAAMDATGQISDSVCTALATAWANILTGLNGLTLSFGDPLETVVASFTTGQTHPIVSVVVNSLADVQHRREDSIAMSSNASHGVS